MEWADMDCRGCSNIRCIYGHSDVPNSEDLRKRGQICTALDGGFD